MRSLVLLSLCPALAFAQIESPEVSLMNLASGTSRNSESASMPMLMRPECGSSAEVAPGYLSNRTISRSSLRTVSSISDFSDDAPNKST